jgi:hypothetical protein
MRVWHDQRATLARELTMQIWLLVQTGPNSIFALGCGTPFSSTEEANTYAIRVGFKNFIFATTLKEA